MNEEHYSAVQAQLEAGNNLSGHVHDTALTDTDGQLIRSAYVVLYGGAPEEIDDARLTSPQTSTTRRTYRYTVRSVAPTAKLARDLSDRCSAQLLNFAPAISGRKSRPITVRPGGDVRFDTSVRPSLAYIDDVYTLITEPA